MGRMLCCTPLMNSDSEQPESLRRREVLNYGNYLCLNLSMQFNTSRKHSKGEIFGFKLIQPRVQRDLIS